MDTLIQMIVRIVQFFTFGGDKRRSGSPSSTSGSNAHMSNTMVRARNFDDDYGSAMNIFMARMGTRFPDNFHARVGSDANSTRDFGDERADAIDKGSATIAAALRTGATVKQAADAGATNVGI